jgi:hypothetical protein
MKWVCLLCLVLFGCEQTSEDKAIELSTLTKWGQVLIDCPTAQATITSHSARTLFITGCGLKICCCRVYGETNYSCFPCRKEQWY